MNKKTRRKSWFLVFIISLISFVFVFMHYQVEKNQTFFLENTHYFATISATTIGSYLSNYDYNFFTPTYTPYTQEEYNRYINFNLFQMNPVYFKILKENNREKYYTDYSRDVEIQNFIYTILNSYLSINTIYCLGIVDLQGYVPWTSSNVGSNYSGNYEKDVKNSFENLIVQFFVRDYKDDYVGNYLYRLDLSQDNYFMGVYDYVISPIVVNDILFGYLVVMLNMEYLEEQNKSTKRVIFYICIGILLFTLIYFKKEKQL